MQQVKNLSVETRPRPLGRGAKIKLELVKNKYIYILALPVIVYYLIFCYGPMFGIVIAFKRFDIAKGIFASDWVGFKYFTEFFKSIYFPRLMRNTLTISFFDLLFGFPAPIIFALMLNELRNVRFKRVVQTITYLPHFISMVVICGMITDFFSTNGIITKILTWFGGEKVNYLGIGEYFKTIYISTNIWQGIGWGTIIYLAALSAVDQELYEAAEVDGASRMRKLISITLPGIAPTIVTMLLLRLGQIMSVGYEKIILLYNEGTYEYADVISSFVYRRGLGGQVAQYSYSAAVGLFQSVINLILLTSANFVSKRISDMSLFD